MRVLARLAIIAAMAVLGIGGAGYSAHAAAGQVIILDSSVCGGINSPEANAVTDLGYMPVLASDTQWDSMTTSQFASYAAIVVGDDNDCGPYPVAAAANASAWAAAAAGNVVTIAGDPGYHSIEGDNSSGAFLTIERSIAFAASGARTGAYVALGDGYSDDEPLNPVALLSGFGTFSAEAYGNSHETIVGPGPTGLTDANLSGWGQSQHEVFDTWPANFTVFAVGLGTETDSIHASGVRSNQVTNEYPYILVREGQQVGPGVLDGSASCNYASGTNCRQSYRAYLNCLGSAGNLSCRGTLIANTPSSFHSRTITSAGFTPANGCSGYCRGGTASMTGTGTLSGVGLVPFSATFTDNGIGRAGAATLTINGTTYQYACRTACNIIHTR
ncbi:MAG: hypothetical protein ACRDFS_03580 [Chloroflexota bacterium]